MIIAPALSTPWRVSERVGPKKTHMCILTRDDGHLAHSWVYNVDRDALAQMRQDYESIVQTMNEAHAPEPRA